MQAFMSHESVSETVRIVRATTSRMMRDQARAGEVSEEGWYDVRADNAVRSELLISSASVTRIGSHDHVRIWSRGGLAGELVVSAGDGEMLARRLDLLPKR